MTETLDKPAAKTVSEEVLYEVSDAIATLTLNRPDRMNAISGPMLARLTQLLIQANEDPKVRVIVLTGAGRAFCVGLDLVDATQGSGIGSEAQTSSVSVRIAASWLTRRVSMVSEGPSAMGGIPVLLGRQAEGWARAAAASIASS